MKKLVLLFLLTAFSLGAQAQVKWMTMKEAVAAQKKTISLSLSMLILCGVGLAKC